MLPSKTCSQCGRTGLHISATIVVRLGDATLFEAPPFCATCFLRSTLKDIDSGLLKPPPELEAFARAEARARGILPPEPGTSL